MEQGIRHEIMLKGSTKLQREQRVAGAFRDDPCDFFFQGAGVSLMQYISDCLRLCCSRMEGKVK